MTRDDVRMYRFRGAPFMAPEIHRGPCIIRESGFDTSNPYDPEQVWPPHSMTNTETVNMYRVRMYQFVGAPFMAPANPQGPMYNMGKRVR
jgi:hypothetical protein